MKGVVLSAGRGSRLAPITSYVPKPLLPIGERRVIDRVLEYLTEMCDEIVVVAGHLSDLLERYLKKRGYPVQIVKVDRVPSGNLYSLLRAEDLVRGEEFVIANADHLFFKGVWDHFPKERSGIEVLCHRRGLRKIQEDEMKVKVSGERLVFMSKELGDYDGAYIGLAFVGKDISEAFWEAAKEVYRLMEGSAKVEDVFNSLAGRGIVRVNFADEVEFYEIDTIEDIRRVWYEARARHL